MVLQAIVYDPAPEQPPLRGSTLRILDQLALPHQTTYIDIPNCEAARAAIKKMQVRGAPAIAIVAALALAVELSKEHNNRRSEDSSLMAEQQQQQIRPIPQELTPEQMSYMDRQEAHHTIAKNLQIHEHWSPAIKTWGQLKQWLHQYPVTTLPIARIEAVQRIQFESIMETRRKQQLQLQQQQQQPAQTEGQAQTQPNLQSQLLNSGHTVAATANTEVYVQHIKSRLAYLMTSRPTAVNLGDAVRKLSKVVDLAAASSPQSGTSIMLAYIQAAEQMLVDDVSDNKAIGDHGARWIVANTTAGAWRRANEVSELKILTHCNTGSLATAGYGTALGVIRSLRAADMLTEAYCSETRPYNQGSRLTAYELVHDNIPATLVTDSMAASLLAREGRDLAAVVVGADRVAANGDTANKIGTYSLAVLARHHGVKFLVAAPRTTIDLDTASGQDITIEERAPEEVTRIRGPVVTREGELLVKDQPTTVSTAAIGINVWNPAFDVTPAALIDGVITEVGVVEKNAEGHFDFAAIFRKAG